jgi:hypothetical protein
MSLQTIAEAGPTPIFDHWWRTKGSYDPDLDWIESNPLPEYVIMETKREKRIRSSI